jgi:hypothetical protein
MQVPGIVTEKLNAIQMQNSMQVPGIVTEKLNAIQMQS